MGKHRDRHRKLKAKQSGKRQRYGTDSYDTGSSEFSGDDAMDHTAYAALPGVGDYMEHEQETARKYLNEQASTCGRITSALFALVTISLAGLAIMWANADGPTHVDCGEQNPLNVSYFNWLILLGVALGAVFLMQLLVAVVACCSKPDVETSLPDWNGKVQGSKQAVKWNARRISCASCLVMVMGSVLAFWMAYGLWVFIPPFDIYNNGTVVAAKPDNKELFASPGCYQLNRHGFTMEIIVFSYMAVYMVTRCCCGVGFCAAMSLLRPFIGDMGA